jgi:hypothetical protein
MSQEQGIWGLENLSESDTVLFTTILFTDENGFQYPQHDTAYLLHNCHTTKVRIINASRFHTASKDDCMIMPHGGLKSLRIQLFQNGIPDS